MCGHNLTLKFPPDFHNYTGVNGLVNSFFSFTIAPPNKSISSCKPLPANLLKKKLWNMCFPVNFPKFLRTPFSQNTSGPLLLPGDSKPAVCRSSTKQVFLNNSQNSQENTYVRVTFLEHLVLQNISSACS